MKTNHQKLHKSFTDFFAENRVRQLANFKVRLIIPATRAAEFVIGRMEAGHDHKESVDWLFEMFTISSPVGATDIPESQGIPMLLEIVQKSGIESANVSKADGVTATGVGARSKAKVAKDADTAAAVEENAASKGQASMASAPKKRATNSKK